jgi:hypothetical protein
VLVARELRDPDPVRDLLNAREPRCVGANVLVVAKLAARANRPEQLVERASLIANAAEHEARDTDVERRVRSVERLSGPIDDRDGDRCAGSRVFGAGSHVGLRLGGD